MKVGEGREKTLILECGGGEKPYPAMGDDESYSISVSAKNRKHKPAASISRDQKLSTIPTSCFILLTIHKAKAKMNSTSRVYKKVFISNMLSVLFKVAF